MIISYNILLPFLALPNIQCPMNRGKFRCEPKRHYVSCKLKSPLKSLIKIEQELESVRPRMIYFNIYQTLKVHSLCICHDQYQQEKKKGKILITQYLEYIAIYQPMVFRYTNRIRKVNLFKWKKKQNRKK